MAVLASLHEQADAMHSRAALDEDAACSSALAWLYRELRISRVRSETSTAWLLTMPLVPTVLALCAGPDTCLA